jgi:hypothetical protein
MPTSVPERTFGVEDEPECFMGRINEGKWT